MEKRETPALLVGCKLIKPLRRTVYRFLKKLKRDLKCDPAIPLLGNYPKKTIFQKDTCTPVFIAAPFTIVALLFPLLIWLTDNLRIQIIYLKNIENSAIISCSNTMLLLGTLTSVYFY